MHQLPSIDVDTSDRRNIGAEYLETLCSAIPDRRPGGVGNRAATEYVAAVLTDIGWQVI